MKELHGQLEAILFLLTKPVSFAKIAKILGIKEHETRVLVKELSVERNVSESGIHLIVTQDDILLATNPAFANILQAVGSEELQADLTAPQLETLTIIAYRGPITKPEIEHIRGVNCSIILRNLLIRGLIEEHEDSAKISVVFSISADMLKQLGAHDVSELPDYNSFHKNAKIDQLLCAITAQPEDL